MGGILRVVSMQKLIKQTFWHHCLFTDVIMRNELILKWCASDIY